MEHKPFGTDTKQRLKYNFTDSKVQGANMGPTWVLSAPDGPHVGPMNLAIRVRDPTCNPKVPYLSVLINRV